MKILDFPLPAPTTRLSERAASFLAAGEPPLVFTTGTGVCDVEGFFGHAKECCSLLKRRGLFLSPYLPATSNVDPFVRSLDFEELGLVLPHSALLVHHGGIGTLARAVEAGVPQIVSPMKYDQPDNAHRVEDLGLGARLERGELNGRSLAPIAERLLGGGWDRRRLTEARDLVRASSAVTDCASLLESVLPLASRSRTPRAEHSTADYRYGDLSRAATPQ
jgi:rhamnosyltransferase subunit B